jgi:hypothetical protein
MPNFIKKCLFFGVFIQLQRRQQGHENQSEAAVFVSLWLALLGH